MDYKPDIYNISDTVNKLQKKYMELDEETLSMSTYGYLNENFASNLQDAIIIGAEMGNEALPIKCKFEKTILTNAITYNIENINAKPASIEVMIGLVEKELVNNMVSDTFVIDKECKLEIGDFDFHLDYDVIITKSKNINTGENTYAARYDIKKQNPISDITNPFLNPPPISLVVNNDKFIFITCTIRQITIRKEHKKIISNNILENKTFDFELDNDEQLASFDVTVNEDGKITYLTPVFEGMPPQGIDRYCFYTYLNKTTIRVKFEKKSYEPKLNSDIEIMISTTKGYGGNFKYSSNCINTLSSDNIEYNGLSVLIKPITNSEYGRDRKTVDDLKQIIPKEILARGSITNNKDLENFFNMIDTENKLNFYRRRDNQFERLYYSYLLAKDNNDNVIPTNTINILARQDEIEYEDERYIINPGTKIIYKDGYGYFNKEEQEKDFVYSTPFIIALNKSLSVSYYLNIIDRSYYFNFEYINQNSLLQFISTYMDIKKIYMDDNKYKIYMNISQNINEDKNLITFDDKGNIINSKIKPALVLYSDTDYKYYLFGNITSYDPQSLSYEVEFELESDNIINRNNQIKIKNMYIGGTDKKGNVYFNEKTSLSVFIYTEFDKEYGREEADKIIPNMDGYTLCNKFTTTEQINLFYNFSGIIKSTVSVSKDEDKYLFKIKGVPVVRYSYLNDVNRCINLINYLYFRKVYIDGALQTIENGFSIDLKFFNTYGPSKMFYIDDINNQLIDRVNLTLNFKLKLKMGSDKETKDKILLKIKQYVENINEINSIHMSNLTTYIKNEFKSDIDYIEFIGMNNYNALYQYIYKEDKEILDQVPEFLNINLIDDEKPDINIILV